ncbi:lipase 3-like [Achroia grisella]|uniref:lipase 3-like n=1 Tax=Achroia grisella TaxID=688607 RepID=UPI0027D263C0|nr:lipase 3-like [Achroia grisella]
MWSGLYMLIGLVVCSTALPEERNREPVFTIDQIPDWINHVGYVAETHHVITHDGYILEMHRIPYAQYQTTSTAKRPVAFLMHGLLAASNSYIALGPQYSIAYNLADAGFDVWLGNARGNRLSRHHVALDPNHPQDKLKFFDFSFEEIGMYDVAQMIDYVLEYTDEEKLHYVGHSQGGTVFLVMASMLPEYNQKFTSVQLLAGVGYQDYFPNIPMRAAARFTNVIHAAALTFGIVELSTSMFNRTVSSSTETVPADCAGDDIDEEFLCELMAINGYLIDLTPIRILYYMFGGAALKQIAHYGQNVRDKSFRRWNYGTKGNIEVYGSITPPIYNLSLITANVTMHYTINDNLLDERDVLAMAKDMPNTRVRKIPRDTFLHVDFVFARDVKEQLTDYMIESMLYLENANEPGTDPGPGEINNSSETDASSVVTLSLIFKIYLSIYTLWVLL